MSIPAEIPQAVTITWRPAVTNRDVNYPVYKEDRILPAGTRGWYSSQLGAFASETPTPGWPGSTYAGMPALAVDVITDEPALFLTYRQPKEG